MAGAKWCIMLNFAGPIGDCCIIFERKRQIFQRLAKNLL